MGGPGTKATSAASPPSSPSSVGCSWMDGGQCGAAASGAVSGSGSWDMGGRVGAAAGDCICGDGGRRRADAFPPGVVVRTRARGVGVGIAVGGLLFDGRVSALRTALIARNGQATLRGVPPGRGGVADAEVGRSAADGEPPRWMGGGSCAVETGSSSGGSCCGGGYASSCCEQLLLLLHPACSALAAATAAHALARGESLGLPSALLRAARRTRRVTSPAAAASPRSSDRRTCSNHSCSNSESVG